MEQDGYAEFRKDMTQLRKDLVKALKKYTERRREKFLFLDGLLVSLSGVGVAGCLGGLRFFSGDADFIRVGFLCIALVLWAFVALLTILSYILAVFEVDSELARINKALLLFKQHELGSDEFESEFQSLDFTPYNYGHRAVSYVATLCFAVAFGFVISFVLLNFSLLEQNGGESKLPSESALPFLGGGNPAPISFEPVSFNDE